MILTCKLRRPSHATWPPHDHDHTTPHHSIRILATPHHSRPITIKNHHTTPSLIIGDHTLSFHLLKSSEISLSIISSTHHIQLPCQFPFLPSPSLEVHHYSSHFTSKLPLPLPSPLPLHPVAVSPLIHPSPFPSHSLIRLPFSSTLHFTLPLIHLLSTLNFLSQRSPFSSLHNSHTITPSSRSSVSPQVFVTPA